MDSIKKDDKIIALISRSQHRLKEYMKREFLSHGIILSPVQSGILFILKKKDAMSMTELSLMMGVDNSSITGIVDRLERAGFVERGPDPDDRRKLLISITNTGSAEIDRANVLVKKVNEKIKEGFSEDEINIFKEVLHSFFKKFP